MNHGGPLLFDHAWNLGSVRLSMPDEKGICSSGILVRRGSGWSREWPGAFPAFSRTVARNLGHSDEKVPGEGLEKQ
jgi:hypothetical protein